MIKFTAGKTYKIDPKPNTKAVKWECLRQTSRHQVLIFQNPETGDRIAAKAVQLPNYEVARCSLGVLYSNRFWEDE